MSWLMNVGNKRRKMKKIGRRIDDRTRDKGRREKSVKRLVDLRKVSKSNKK